MISQAYLFFIIFTRLEYAMKASGILRDRRDGRDAIPGWASLRKSFNDFEGADDVSLQSALNYLTSEETRPQKQIVLDSVPIYEDLGLRGNNQFQQAIDALKRVRDNLFYGGKSEDPDQDRNEELINHSLVIIRAMLISRPDLLDKFTDLEFQGIQVERQVIDEWLR